MGVALAFNLPVVLASVRRPPAAELETEGVRVKNPTTAEGFVDSGDRVSGYKELE